MTISKVLYSSKTPHWATPECVYRELNNEFHFNDDGCALYEKRDGLEREWGTRTFVNPPYGRLIGRWIRKAYAESKRGKLVVMLLPARTDTKWWHEYAMKADEIRFCRGRLHFDNSKYSAPFPSAIIIFKGNCPE